MFLCFFFSKILHPKKNHPSITPFDILIANSNYYHSNTNQRIHSHITHIENISACSILARYWFAWCCGATNKPSLSLDCGYDYYGNDDVDYGGDVDNGKKSTNIGRMCVRASSLLTCVCACEILCWYRIVRVYWMIWTCVNTTTANRSLARRLQFYLLVARGI